MIKILFAAGVVLFILLMIFMIFAGVCLDVDDEDDYDKDRRFK